MKRDPLETPDKLTRYVVISPVRDEEAYVEHTIKSVISQTMLPLQWVIVNDGSRDTTGAIVERYAKKYSWIRAIHLPDRGFRKSGGGVIEAFYEGYDSLTVRDWDFIVKLDGDLSFDADYFEESFKYFVEDSSLGIGGGVICVFNNGQLRIDSIGDPLFHVRGATKIYRRACWEQISPLAKTPGWDTLDEVKANMLEWKTRNFADLKLLQHRHTGAAEGAWKNWVKNGQANYLVGYHPLFMIGKCVRRLAERPLLVSSLGLMVGFLGGYFAKIPRSAEKEVITYLRKQQLRKLFFLPGLYGNGNGRFLRERKIPQAIIDKGA